MVIDVKSIVYAIEKSKVHFTYIEQYEFGNISSYKSLSFLFNLYGSSKLNIFSEILERALDML